MVLRQRLMEQMESRMQVEDEELRDLIDMAILEAAEGAYLPLKERLCLRKELFDSFRRLDILQELVDDPTITEIMVNGTEHIFVERQGRVEELEKHFDSVGQLGVIQYYNVLFIMELVSDKDIWALEQWMNGINNIYMKDIHNWCRIHFVKYHTVFVYRKEYPVKANIWNGYSYIRWRMERLMNLG